MVFDYEICPECNWENDPHQLDNPDMRGGANRESLNEARTLYASRKKVNHDYHDYYVRVIIEIRDNKSSSIRYDLNMLTKELGVWINGEWRNTCQGYNLNDEQCNELKRVLRQMKHDYENPKEKPLSMDIDRNVKSHYIAALIKDDGYPLVKQSGVSCENRLIRILASFTLSFKERQAYL